LSKKDIRLEYSGFMIFAAKMFSVVTGLIFQYIVADSLVRISVGGKTEYDYWANVNDIAAIFTLMAGVLPFWIMRFATREKRGAVKTGILANLTISFVATLIYLPLVPFITSTLGISVNYLSVYFLIAIQIIEFYSVNVLEACLQARIPQAVGYGLLVQQVCKVVLGYMLIVQLDLFLLGAIVATIAGFAIQIAYYFRLLVQELREKIEWKYAKEWLKGSLMNIYNVAGNQLANTIFIMLFVYGSGGAGEMGGRGIYNAAATVINVITYSSVLAFALYPKLLTERRSEHITTSLKMVLMFAIPMTAEAVALSESYITILKAPVDATPMLAVLSIDAFVAVISGVLSSVLYGIETVDEESKLSLRQLTKSRLFVAFSLPYFHAAISLPTAFYVLTNCVQNQPVLAALYVSIINSSARFAMFLVLYAIVRKMIAINIPWKNIAKYVFAAAVTGTVLYLVPHSSRIPLTLAETATGGIIYLVLLMAIDKEARKLPGKMLREIRQKKPTALGRS
jgi:hypothetical protein